MLFNDLLSFLNIDFGKGLMAGNLPRRCENCGKYFPAIGAYDTRYCNEVTPGETTRTCRMVGAHRKEKAKTKSKTILMEYTRVYNRIKARKRNGKITKDEWNKLVAYIQDIKAAALQGKYTDEEVKQIFDKSKRGAVVHGNGSISMEHSKKTSYILGIFKDVLV